MSALYLVASELRQLLDQADPETGELPADLGERLGQLSLSMDEKIDGIGGYIADLKMHRAVAQAKFEQAHAEAERLKAIAAYWDNRIEGVKRRTQECLQLLCLKDHRTALFYVWLQKSPPACEFTGVDPKNLPEFLQRVSVEPNKSAAIEEWKKTGKAPDGFEVKQSMHLRVR